MKKLIFYKRLFVSLIATQFFLLLVGSFNLYQMTYGMKQVSDYFVQQQVDKEIESLKSMTLAEIMDDPRTKAKLSLLTAKDSKSLSVKPEEMVSQIQSWTQIFYLSLFLSFVISFSIYYVLKKKVTNTLESKISSFVEKLIKLYATQSEHTQWPKEILYLILDYNGLSKYKGLVDRYIPDNEKSHSDTKAA